MRDLFDDFVIRFLIICGYILRFQFKFLEFCMEGNIDLRDAILLLAEQIGRAQMKRHNISIEGE